MKKLRFISLIVLFTLVITFAMAGETLAAKPTKVTTTTINYTALGDSIAFGIGADLYYGYVGRYRDYLDSLLNTDVNLSNQSFPGDDTSDLLFKVKYYSWVRTDIANANLITISIGGNNILGYASDNYTVIDEVGAQQGVDKFKTEWSLIMNEIRALNKTATVKVLNLYNPYPVDDPNYALADSLIQQLNLESSEKASVYNYTVIDAYTAFAGNSCTYTHFCDSTPDVHPTNSGYALIAELHR